MTDKNSMSVTVRFQKNQLHAWAHIKIPRNPPKELSFLLNRDIRIGQITGNTKIEFKKTGEETPPFKSLSQHISVRGEEALREIFIEYSGEVQFDPKQQKNWYNSISEDIISLSSYSVWYPQKVSVDLEVNRVMIPNGRDWFVVKAGYDVASDTWVYEDQAFDPYNIVAFRKDKLQKISTPHMNVFFVDSSIREKAEKAQEFYKEILDYYNGNLFERRTVPILDIACCYPDIKTGGGYRRKDLMWCVSLGDGDQEIAWQLAHETAHIWCTGADMESWEDWLNETTAEWASLLFALQKRDMTLFEFILKPKKERFHSLPAIKTTDGSRPAGVHDKGTILFYHIFQKVGYEAMRQVIRCFAQLKEKNTENFLVELRHNDLAPIADMIKDNLSK